VSGSDVSISSTPVDWSKFANEMNDERITQGVEDSSSGEAMLTAAMRSKGDDDASSLKQKRSLVASRINDSNRKSTSALAVVSPTPPPPRALTAPVPTHSSLKYIGNDWEPLNRFPLGECEGDCDEDGDCAGDLICFERKTDGYKPVPGCLGGEDDSSGTDYCIRAGASIVTAPPTTAPPTISPAPTPAYASLKKVGNDWDPSNGYPLSECEGDCDIDRDCEGDLICFQRDGIESVPGCLGGEDESGRTDYCIRAGASIVTAPPTTASPTISPAPTPAYPRLRYVGNERDPSLGECEGDCDKNSDCRGGLICFQRDGTESVPGCLGGEEESKGTDYCIRSGARIVTARPTTAPPTISPAPTLNPTTAPPTPLPTSLPTPVPTPIPTKNPSGLLDYTKPGRDSNLKECEGDCDRNRDCVGDLICYQRENGGEPLPGCEGTPNGDVDFCIKPEYTYEPTPRPTRRPTPRPTRKPTRYPTAAPTFTPIPGGSPVSRIKMYWQFGYNWQESYTEKKYCMQCRNRKGAPEACDVGMKIELYDCNRSHRQKFVRVEGDNSIRPAMSPHLCMSHQNRADDIYLDTLTLEYCNGGKQQQFWIVGTPWQENGKFEIRTNLISNRNPTCLTNPHHPRRKENIIPQRCDRARDHLTSSWTLY